MIILNYLPLFAQEIVSIFDRVIKIDVNQSLLGFAKHFESRECIYATEIPQNMEVVHLNAKGKSFAGLLRKFQSKSHTFQALPCDPIVFLTVAFHHLCTRFKILLCI